MCYLPLPNEQKVIVLEQGVAGYGASGRNAGIVSLAVMASRVLGLVLAPTRELATQIADALRPLAERDGRSLVLSIEPASAARCRTAGQARNGFAPRNQQWIFPPTRTSAR